MNMRVVYQWPDPRVGELAAYLQGEIDKAMALPAWAMRSPDAFHRHLARCYKVTEVLRRELVKLYIEHATPVMLVKNDEDY